MPDDTSAKKRGRRGTGSVFQKSPGKDKPWAIQYYRPDPETGKVKREREYKFTGKAEAQRALSDRLGRLARGEQFDAGRKVTVFDLYKALLTATQADAGPGSRKVAGLGWRWTHLKPFFAHLSVVFVTTTRINQYKTDRRTAGAAVATINRELATLRRMFRYGKQCTPPLVHNIPHFGLPKENNARQGFIEDANYQRMAEEAAKDGLWMRLFIALAYNYGWRRGELIGLHVRQVDLPNTTLRLNPGTTKNGEGREVPISDSALLEMLRTACEDKQPDDSLFTRKGTDKATGEVVDLPVKDFRGAWRNLCVRAGVGEYRCADCSAAWNGKRCECGSRKRKYVGLIPHDFRRSAARRLRRQGTHENVIMAIGGWKTRSMFDRYAIVNNDDKRRAMEALAESRTSVSPRLAPESNFDPLEGDNIEKAAIQ